MTAATPAPWVGGLFVALGFGAALIGGQGIAHADTADHGPNRGGDSAHSAPRSTTARTHANSQHITSASTRLTTKRSTPATPVKPPPDAATPVALASARRQPGSGVARPAPRPPAQAAPPVPDVVAIVTTWLNDVHDYLAGAGQGRPHPADMTLTPYGTIGKWMLAPTGGVADWPSQGYPLTTLYQPINVVIIDPTSTTAEESAEKLNAALTSAGFPAQQIHASGYSGVIDGVAYGQQPAGTLEAFADAHWLLTNDHGRVFGPAPSPDGAGFVWTASFSRERTGLVYIIPTHVYVSFSRARNAVRDALVADGATDLGMVDLDNKLSGRTTTGDHDGYAVVIRLN